LYAGIVFSALDIFIITLITFIISYFIIFDAVSLFSIHYFRHYYFRHFIIAAAILFHLFRCHYAVSPGDRSSLLRRSSFTRALLSAQTLFRLHDMRFFRTSAAAPPSFAASSSARGAACVCVLRLLSRALLTFFFFHTMLCLPRYLSAVRAREVRQVLRLAFALLPCHFFGRQLPEVYLFLLQAAAASFHAASRQLAAGGLIVRFRSQRISRLIRRK